MNRKDITQAIGRRMHKEYPDVQIWVYGSEARGEARADSDIDLLVLTDKPRLTHEEEMQMMTPLYDIELETGIPINPVFMYKQDWGKRITPFYENVMRDRIAI